VAEATFGLVGVVIGGLITAFVSYLLESRRERREARIARRLVRSDFDEADHAVTDALAGRGWPAGWTDRRWSDSWSVHRRPLAASMSDKDFAEIATAALYMELLQTGLVAGTRPFIQGDEAFLQVVHAHLEDARSLLGPAGR
jgi:hypothetical protein